MKDTLWGVLGVGAPAAVLLWATIWVSRDFVDWFVVWTAFMGGGVIYISTDKDTFWSKVGLGLMILAGLWLWEAVRT